MTLAKASESMSHQEQGVTHTPIHHPWPAHRRGALPWEEPPADKVPAAGLSPAGLWLSLLPLSSLPGLGEGSRAPRTPVGWLVLESSWVGGRGPACSLPEHQTSARFVLRLIWGVNS